jgi:hypothetical protein
MPPWQRPPPMHSFPLTDSTVLEFYEYLFAPWVTGLGIRGFLVKRGEVSAALPQNDSLNFASGAGLRPSHNGGHRYGRFAGNVYY